MELTQLSDLYPLVMAHVHGIDTFTLDQHLQEASRAFCRETEAFRETLTRDLVASTATYVLTPSYDCRVKRVTDVHMLTAADVTAGNQGTWIDPKYYRFNPATNVLTFFSQVVPSVAVTGGLVVEVVLVPQVTQTGNNVISQDFLNVNADGIMEYALFTLMKMPGQRWTNLDPITGAPFHYREYLKCVRDAMSEVAMQNTTEPLCLEG